MKFIKRLFIGFLVIVVLVVGVLGYFGFIPIVSSVFGSDKPHDLGVVSGPKDLASMQEKLGQKLVEPRGDGDTNEQLESSGSHLVDIVITQEEWTEYMMQVNPVSDLQIKVEGDTFEVSGRIDKGRIPGYVRMLGFADISDAEILDAVETYLPLDPVFYFSGTGSATNDDVDVALSKAELGRFPIAVDLASDGLEAYMEALLGAASGFSAQDATLQEGELHFSGSAIDEVPTF